MALHESLTGTTRGLGLVNNIQHDQCTVTYTSRAESKRFQVWLLVYLFNFFGFYDFYGWSVTTLQPSPFGNKTDDTSAKLICGERSRTSPSVQVQDDYLLFKKHTSKERNQMVFREGEVSVYFPTFFQPWQGHMKSPNIKHEHFQIPRIHMDLGIQVSRF